MVVVDAFSKCAWVEPIKSKTGIAVTEAFKKSQNAPKKEHHKHNKKMMEKNFIITHFKN